ncbi:MAG: hypothetical protein MOGMAGMI_00014 [Candidatus Omnitrophica bacterium]|nr:hypothetical protein [Candidatus Omnitrophota bacterium]
MATLSALIPNYNDQGRLSQAIASAVEQSRPPEEVLVIDDGSTDGSLSIIERWLKKDPRVRLVRHERNLGIGEVLRRALVEMRGDWLHFGSANDRVIPGYFERAMGCAERYPQAALVMGRIVVASSDDRFLTRVQSSRWHRELYADPARYLSEYLEVESATHSLGGATLYRADALRAVGGFRYEELGPWCDSFAGRAMGLRHGVCYLPVDGYYWHLDAGSLSQGTRRDPRRMRAIIDRAAALMRSEEYRDLFPADHVTRWERGFRRFVALWSNPLGGAVIDLGTRLPWMAALWRRLRGQQGSPAPVPAEAR